MAILEICVDSIASAATAEEGGAERIELCSALSEGGLTPSLGMIRAVRARVAIRLQVLIRPRSGDFVYSADEVAVMRDDIELAAQAGADGVVLGLLTREGGVDVERTRRLVDFARPMKVTFHRAIDVTHNPLVALEEIIQSGADRVLTSGGQPNALLGSACIHNLVQAAGKRITVIVGGSVRAANAAELARTTGAQEWHSALRAPSLNVGQHSSARSRLASQLGTEPAVTTFKSKDVRALLHALRDVHTVNDDDGSILRKRPLR